ncbi:flagellar biosynthesis protein FliQ [Ramlibacter sp. 2FC]|uniref:flagellar biosynthesis protein FliQ n=1 Tax=Ramlibacter sp. 2FC TaxID=2502188 RepID=UPI0010F506F0|nr:flagellar biosynthesis protein FliQ [Ramlibacter sp. 2FC]
MDAQQVLTLGQQALYLLLTVAAPLLLTALAIGLVVSIVQAATQIHEATLSFVPKLLGAVLVLTVTGPWMLSSLIEFIQRTLTGIPGLVR